MWSSWPLEFDPAAYRGRYADLASMSDEKMRRHWRDHGRAEGRNATVLENRDDFARLVPQTARALEIGPYTKPVLRGPNVRYADVWSSEDLVRRATTDPNVDAAGVPHIHYVTDPSSLSMIDEKFDVVLSSHVIEHQPDLVEHLRQVASVLEPHGAYMLMVPDHRFCFDHFMPATRLADVVAAHIERRTRHDMNSILRARLLMTHNDAQRHWDDDHGEPGSCPDPHLATLSMRERIELTARQSEPGGALTTGYVDCHAWHFTPETFAAVIDDLRTSGLVDWDVVRVYPTMRNTLEFWAVLQRATKYFARG